MRQVIFVFAMIMAFCLSCRTILKARYRINREFTFADRTNYLNFLDRSFSLKPDHVLYVDSLSLFPLVEEMSRHQMAEYYGTLVNDSTEIKKSGFLEENMSCIGRVLKEIQTNNNNIEDSMLVKNDQFKLYKFYTANNDEQFKMQNDSKLKIFLFYSYRSGTYFNKFYKDIAAFSKDNEDKVSVYIISLDPLQNLPR